jgi:plastocyanin
VLARLRSTPAKAALFAAALAASSCGAGATSDLSVPSTPYVITILNYTVDPANLSVPPGATVLVRNQDDFDHWLASETAPGQYVYAKVGEVGINVYVFSRSEQSFSIPTTAAVGTVVPYFCVLSTSAMINQGQITIVSPPAAASGTP